MNVHAQLTWLVRQSDVPADACSNNLYFTFAGTPTQADLDNLAHQLALTFTSGVGFGSPQPWTKWTGRDLVVKLYDMGQPKPRPVAAVYHYSPTTWATGALGPRALAICLSFYAGRNLPHTRGRIYLGPWDTGDIQEVPFANVLLAIMDLAKGIFTIGSRTGGSWEHVQHSTITNLYNPVTNYWANDVWDVQHSREHVEMSRQKYP